MCGEYVRRKAIPEPVFDQSRIDSVFPAVFAPLRLCESFLLFPIRLEDTGSICPESTSCRVRPSAPRSGPWSTTTSTIPGTATGGPPTTTWTYGELTPVMRFEFTYVILMGEGREIIEIWTGYDLK